MDPISWDRGTLVVDVAGQPDLDPAALPGVLAAVFPADPPRFMARTPHGYHDEQAIVRDLAQGGFVSAAPAIDTVAEPVDPRGRTPDEVLDLAWRRELLERWMQTAQERGMGAMTGEAARWVMAPRSFRRLVPTFGWLGPLAMGRPTHSFDARSRGQPRHPDPAW